MNRMLLIALLLTSVSHAQWSTDPANNLIVGNGLLPELASDGAGGCYITYEQNLSYPRRLILERLNRYGFKPWGAGRQILGLLPEQSFAKITEDGFGGVIVSYLDIRVEGTPHLPEITARLRVQRVDSNGNFLWGSTGVRVTLSETNQAEQAIVSDGAGGCIVAWVDTLGDLRINRINGAGYRVWGDSGRYVWNSPARPPLVGDGRGGCFIRFGVGRLQRLDSQGNPYWPGPIQVPTSGGTLRSDGAANVYLLGSKVLGYQNGELLFTVNLQKVDTTGSLLWDSLGIVLDTINANNFPPTWGLSLNNTYIWVCWPQRSGGQWDLRTQVIRTDGSNLFAEGGIPVSGVPSGKGLVGVLPSDSVSSLFVWGDSRTPGGIYAQRLDTLGRTLWDTNDVILNLPQFSDMVVTSDANGGCIGVGFHQFDFSIRALQINKHGNLGQVITSVEDKIRFDFPLQPVLYQNYPNPFNPQTTIRFELPRAAPVNLALYNILGQSIKTLVSGTREAGVHSVILEAGELPSGTYLYRLTTPEAVLIHKLIILK